MRSVNGTELVFISSFGPKRADGKTNYNNMFRKTGVRTAKWRTRYFEHIRGPWERETNSSCAITVDLNNDGLDDLIVCNRGGGNNAQARFFQQRKNGRFLRNIWNNNFVLKDWRNAAVGDVTGDGLPDLAVVYGGANQSFLRVFRGILGKPWFDV